MCHRVIVRAERSQEHLGWGKPIEERPPPGGDMNACAGRVYLRSGKIGDLARVWKHRLLYSAEEVSEQNLRKKGCASNECTSAQMECLYGSCWSCRPTHEKLVL